jgi:hypothetical protein
LRVGDPFALGLCVNECNIDPSYRTDHSIIFLSLRFQDFHKGKGLWKFNNSLLYDKEFVAKVKSTVSNVKLQYSLPVYKVDQIPNIPDNEISFVINDQLFLEVLLMEIRGESISHSSYVKKNKREKELHKLCMEFYIRQSSAYCLLPTAHILFTAFSLQQST